MSAATSYEVVPASIRHVRPLAKRMRAAGSMAVEAYGFNPREGLRRVYVASCYAQTALIDGRPVAMWGMVGTLLGDTARAWLVLTDEIASMPRAILMEARKHLAAAANHFGEILATVLPDDEASVRFARHLGFVGDERVSLGDGFALEMTWRSARGA